MSRTRHASVFFCLFGALISACPDAGDNPDPGKDAGLTAGAGTDMTANNELGGTTAQPAAGSGGRAASAGTAAGAAGQSGGTGPAAGQGGSEAMSEDDAGIALPPATKDCVVGGCSSQLCTDAASGPVVSTCEWREEYGCYRAATCAKQNNGQCGWTQTPELMQCLQQAGRP